jgi:hypothetical protein
MDAQAPGSISQPNLLSDSAIEHHFVNDFVVQYHFVNDFAVQQPSREIRISRIPSPVDYTSAVLC